MNYISLNFFLLSSGLTVNKTCALRIDLLLHINGKIPIDFRLSVLEITSLNVYDYVV